MLDSRINKWWCNVLDSGSNQTSSLSKQITLMLKYSSNHINVLWFSDMCCKSCNSPWSLSGLEWRSWVRLSFQELCCIMQWSWLFYFSCNTDRTWFLPKSYTCANKCGYMVSKRWALVLQICSGSVQYFLLKAAVVHLCYNLHSKQ